jgi:hypothetical protein
VDVRLEFAQQRVHVEIVEYYDVRDCFERGNQRRATPLRQYRTPLALEPRRARVGIDTDDQKIALGSRGLQVADVPCVQEIENPIREDDSPPGATMLVEHVVKPFS